MIQIVKKMMKKIFTHVVNVVDITVLFVVLIEKKKIMVFMVFVDVVIVQHV